MDASFFLMMIIPTCYPSVHSTHLFSINNPSYHHGLIVRAVAFLYTVYLLIFYLYGLIPSACIVLVSINYCYYYCHRCMFLLKLSFPILVPILDLPSF